MANVETLVLVVTEASGIGGISPIESEGGDEHSAPNTIAPIKKRPLHRMASL